MLENKNFAAVSAKSAATVDEGLRQYMIKVYNYMAAGLCLTAFAAYLVANTSLIRLFFQHYPAGRQPVRFGLAVSAGAVSDDFCFRLGHQPRHAAAGSGRILGLFGSYGHFSGADFPDLYR